MAALGRKRPVNVGVISFGVSASTLPLNGNWRRGLRARLKIA